MKIAVLAGGLSPEREVSLSSGSLIANALCACGHEVALADVYLGTDGKTPSELFSKEGNYSHTIPQTPPDLEALRKKAGIKIDEKGLRLHVELDYFAVFIHKGLYVLILQTEY